MTRVLFAVSRRPVRHRSGFTLPEFMVVVVLTATLQALAMPSYRLMLDRVHLLAATTAFHQAVLLARSEAMKRGVRVDLVPAVAQEWRDGWVVLIDTNNNQTVDQDEFVLHRSPLPHAGLQITASLRDTKKAYLAFDPSGRPRSISNSALPQIGSLMFSVGAQKRKIVIGFLGRLRICDPNRDGTAC